MQTRKKTGRLALLAVLVAFFPLALLAAGFGTLNGKVTDAKTGKVIAGAVVKIQIGKGIAAQTSKDGYYLFSNIVPTGTVSLTVGKDGYETKTVSKITITTGVKNLNVTLSPKAPATPPPAPAPAPQPGHTAPPPASAPAPQPGHTASPPPAQPPPATPKP